VLDEFTYPMAFGWVDAGEVVDVLVNRPGFQHVIVTGRGAPAGLVEAADLVSEVHKLKHPFDRGIRGQQGIEW
jgi:cob(I)alamin adenosyltransferase